MHKLGGRQASLFFIFLLRSVWITCTYHCCLTNISEHLYAFMCAYICFEVLTVHALSFRPWPTHIRISTITALLHGLTEGKKACLRISIDQVWVCTPCYCLVMPREASSTASQTPIVLARGRMVIDHIC